MNEKSASSPPYRGVMESLPQACLEHLQQVQVTESEREFEYTSWSSRPLVLFYGLSVFSVSQEFGEDQLFLEGGKLRYYRGPVAEPCSSDTHPRPPPSSCPPPGPASTAHAEHSLFSSSSC
ncbi:hypothetical protein DNTS_035150 [Danionella cerebrum]|uniref:Uncharacterized protein n=1 Tax=Danionella cerebrum TaxID=2873325 RepID=A0A553N635_9TELE|nr:hypothetical protein DNTS_035150 [Danionella translucida]